ncbi:MAG: hypothetical protein ACYDCX_05160 [Acidithiobacillus sp.]
MRLVKRQSMAMAVSRLTRNLAMMPVARLQFPLMIAMVRFFSAHLHPAFAWVRRDVLASLFLLPRPGL